MSRHVGFRQLRVLRLDLGFTGVKELEVPEVWVLSQFLTYYLLYINFSIFHHFLGFLFAFQEMPQLQQLMLRFTGSRLKDASGLSQMLTPKLRSLELWFSNLPQLGWVAADGLSCSQCETGFGSRTWSRLKAEELIQRSVPTCCKMSKSHLSRRRGSKNLTKEFSCHSRWLSDPPGPRLVQLGGLGDALVALKLQELVLQLNACAVSMESRQHLQHG